MIKKGNYLSQKLFCLLSYYSIFAETLLMVRFFENYSLKAHNTFGVDSNARYFFEFTETEDLHNFFKEKRIPEDIPVLILGGGSNMLFINDFNGLVLHPGMPGIKYLKEDSNFVWLEARAGEVWDDFVKYCVDAGLGGVENLSFIPGNVGASPVQNIGAYGQEAGNVIELVRGYDLISKKNIEFTGKECEFAYRDSIFKREFKNRLVITSVVFRLDKYPEYNLSYGQLENDVNSLGKCSLQTVRTAVIGIRSSKLPDVKEISNAGSFFKNPVVDEATAEKIRVEWPGVPVYPAGTGLVKLAAGWLIEKAGWKGYRENGAGVHDRQALVIVNHGGATGKEIYLLSEKIRRSVYGKFGIELEREVNCI